MRLLENYSHSTRRDTLHSIIRSTKIQSTMHFHQKAATFMNKERVMKLNCSAEWLHAESNIREEYVLQKDEDGEMYCGCSVFCSSVEHG